MIDVGTYQLTAGIAKALAAEFGSEYTVYADYIPQNFSTPSFYVRQISGSFTQQVYNRHILEAVIVVTYFPPEHEKAEQRDLLSTLSRLYPALEYIDGEDGKPLRAESMSHEITDHELHLTLSYRLVVVRPIERPSPMMVLEQVQKLKETGNG